MYINKKLDNFLKVYGNTNLKEYNYLHYQMLFEYTKGDPKEDFKNYNIVFENERIVLKYPNIDNFVTICITEDYDTISFEERFKNEERLVIFPIWGLEC